MRHFSLDKMTTANQDFKISLVLISGISVLVIVVIL